MQKKSWLSPIEDALVPSAKTALINCGVSSCGVRQVELLQSLESSTKSTLAVLKA
jgi:hypothetical protein